MDLTTTQDTANRPAPAPSSFETPSVAILKTSTDVDFKSLFQMNAAAPHVLTNLGARQRDRKEINLRRLVRTLRDKNGVSVDHTQILDVFKALEASKVGSLVIGRGSKPTRFKFGYSIPDIVRVAQEGGKIDALKATPAPKARVESAAPKKAAAKPVLKKAPVAPAAEPEEISEVIIMHGKDLRKVSVVGKEKNAAFAALMQLLND